MKKSILAIMIFVLIIFSIFSIIKFNSIYPDKEDQKKVKHEDTEFVHIENNENKKILYKDDVFSIKKIKKNIYLYTAYGEFGGKKYPANGLILLGEKEITLIDTPWDDEKTQNLLTILKEQFNKSVSDAIITHFHNDRVGGIKILQEENVSVHSTSLTDRLAFADGYPHTLGDLKDGQVLTINGQNLEVYYPGKGHTADNITIYIHRENLLFGGCFVKNSLDETLGNIADADVPEWLKSINRIEDKYSEKQIETVVPGHGSEGGYDLLNHTRNLIEKQIAEDSKEK